MSKSGLSCCPVLFTLHVPLGKALSQSSSPSRVAPSVSFTEFPVRNPRKRKENSHNLHHFHLQPHYLIFRYFYERYFLTLIP